jgi:hypothetical protein
VQHDRLHCTRREALASLALGHDTPGPRIHPARGPGTQLVWAWIHLGLGLDTPIPGHRNIIGPGLWDTLSSGAGYTRPNHTRPWARIRPTVNPDTPGPKAWDTLCPGPQGYSRPTARPAMRRRALMLRPGLRPLWRGHSRCISGSLFGLHRHQIHTERLHRGHPQEYIEWPGRGGEGRRQVGAGSGNKLDMFLPVRLADRGL